MRNFKSFKEIEKFKHCFKSEWRGKLLVELRVIKPSDIGKQGNRSLRALFGKKRKELPERVMRRTIRMPVDEERSLCPL